MCRIAGIISPQTPIQETQSLVKEMCELQKHGGPDDEGMYTCTETGLVLGHRRLSLIDLSSAGHQPMHYANRYTISFNGEIYNYLELKKELESLGSEFETQTDTEVILAAFAKWGTHSFAKLKGMFAFALYDAQLRISYLVRDAGGIKPLYFAASEQGLSFASEVRALKKSHPEENKNWPVYQLAYGHIPEPVTTLSAVRPLPKGCFYTYHISSGKGNLQSFAHYSYSNKITSRAEALQTVSDSLRQSVERHLIADAPLAVFLSGGIDSSIIAALAASFKNENLHTLSLYFEEKHFSEKEFQDILIKTINCKPLQHLLTETEFQEAFPGILQAMDMPSCDGVNTWFISKHAADNNIKAVLSGIGGDELFGGYPSFKRMALAQLLQSSPDSILAWSKNSRSPKFKRLAYLKLAGIKGLYLFLRGQFSPVDIARQLGSTEKQVWEILEDLPVYSPIHGLEANNTAGWMELNLYMQNQLLRDADVMSMAHGVEIRVPFLDDEFLRSSLQIEAAIKYAGKFQKQLLIDAFTNELPEPIWNRKKMGFAFPFTDWLGNSSFVKEMMQGAQPATQKSYHAFLKGDMHWSQLMSLILLKYRGFA